jgi:hypothetical protein
MKHLQLLSGLLFVMLLCGFAPADWLWMENKQTGFKVLFPRQPKVVADSVPSAAGMMPRNGLLYEVGKFKDDNEVYSLLYIDYPDTFIHSDYKDALIEDFLKATVKNSIAEKKATRLSDIKINYKTYAGRRVKMSTNGNNYIQYMQLYLVNSRLYIQEVTCPAANDNNASIDKFLKSFTLL